MTQIEIIEKVISTIKINTKKPEKFLSTQNNIAELIQKTTKLLYDLAKREFDEENNALPELVINGFDDEQIWQELELQNEEILASTVTKIPLLTSNAQKLVLPLSLTEPEDDEEVADNDEEETATPEDEEMADLTDSEDEEDLNIDLDGSRKKNLVQRQRSLKKPSVVDDEFFKLEELDEFLVKEDKKAMKDCPDDLMEDSADEESVDLFEDQSDENDEDLENGRKCRYKDFFDYPHNFPDDQRPEDAEMNENYESEEASDSESKKRKLSSRGSEEKRVKFNLGSDSDGAADEDRDNEEKSSLEKRQERLQMRMHDLEEQAISDKPWQLRGEVSAFNRPQNSLLEEFVEFDAASRPAPEITEEMTMTLEEKIKQRIKDKAWDDVVKKFKPVVTPLEFKKKLVMDQEKSSQSLAEVYERDFLKQRDAQNTEEVEQRQEDESAEQKEIRTLMNCLFRKLDALSNFHYTPKPAQPEVRIISNIPAITMEEVAPVATTDATLLAPEEVKGKRRGEIIGKSEKSKTDSKRERRKKKIFQREKMKKDQVKKASLSEKLSGNLKRKKIQQTNLDIVDKLLKNRNIKKIDDKAGKISKFNVSAFNDLK